MRVIRNLPYTSEEYVPGYNEAQSTQARSQSTTQIERQTAQYKRHEFFYQHRTETVLPRSSKIQHILSRRRITPGSNITRAKSMPMSLPHATSILSKITSPLKADYEFVASAFLLGAIAAAVVAGMPTKALKQTRHDCKALKASLSSLYLVLTSLSAISSTSLATSTITSIPLPVRALSVHGGVTTNCPYLNDKNNTYMARDSNIKFEQECGTNYPGDDLKQIPLTTIEDCPDLCAALVSLGRQETSRVHNRTTAG
ncbi:hypothetical protein BDP81DRAFT_450441 [Colletotrichum phormii]|uniref:Uncharacterized protein n=1 Tax=Colletotrichum phormii TaxID=359342 RepID=A0AAI9ZRB7_9PEZI|nr:uncharacterized protein BDP81DRAFT_450441 [Colletotrichum phormii]KAK1635568.1 hypothetical protein BDP81DRAFT_450441 [Colletotrichum phormii]